MIGSKLGYVDRSFENVKGINWIVAKFKHVK